MDAMRECGMRHLGTAPELEYRLILDGHERIIAGFNGVDRFIRVGLGVKLSSCPSDDTQGVGSVSSVRIG